MLIKYAKEIARQWVIEEASSRPDFFGAFFHGSVNYLSDDDVLPPVSDVDIMIVLSNLSPPEKLGKFLYQGVLLEVSYLSNDQIHSPEQVLGQCHLAGSFRYPSVILDSTGRLTEIQATVSTNFAKRKWVYKRCEHARERVISGCHLNEADSLPDQVIPWLFPTGITTHILLVAGLKNPTVRRRYAAVRGLLADYGRLDFYENLLEALGCADMTRNRVERHLEALTEAFDVAKTVRNPPFSFASDLTDTARAIAIDGSRELIESGYHRDAVFWLIVTYCRCQKTLSLHEDRRMRDRFSPGFRNLLDDVGITSFGDIQQRTAKLQESLPRIWEVVETIIAVNPGIED